jgi:hypothetical protein
MLERGGTSLTKLRSTAIIVLTTETFHTVDHAERERIA